MAVTIINVGSLTASGANLYNGINNMSNPDGSGGIGVSSGISGAVQTLTQPLSPIGIAAGVTSTYTSIADLALAVANFRNAYASGNSDAATSAALGVAASVGGLLSLLPYAPAKGLGIALNLGANAAKNAWDKGWRPVDHPQHDPSKPPPVIPKPVDKNKNNIPDNHEDVWVDPITSQAFMQSQNWVRRVDPLTFDMDGDGLETTALSSTSPILFDHDGDGIKTGTGWINSDDALLVLDRNGNGVIDSGRELFGDNTIKSNGQLAVDGFDALADLDTNADGIVNNLDSQFGGLLLWRDLNQDGVSQSNELFTLSSQNIVGINVQKVEHSQTLSNGNQIADLGSFIKSDGTSGAIGEVTGSIGDINLSESTFYRSFTDTLDTSSVQTLPDMQGSGKLRDLREAATQSASLQNVLTQYSQATTRDGQIALLDNLLDQWADTGGLAETLTQRVVGMPSYAKEDGTSIPYVIHYAAMGDLINANGSNYAPEFAAKIAEWEQKIHVIESFNGSYYFGLPGTQQAQGAIVGLTVSTPMPTSTEVVVSVSFSQQQLDLLEQSYQAIKSSVYNNLLLQTRFKSFIDQINLAIDDTSGEIYLDFSNLTITFDQRIAADYPQGVMDLMEFNIATKTMLADSNWSGWQHLADVLNINPPNQEIIYALNKESIKIIGVDGFNGIGGPISEFILGNQSDNTLNGGSGNDRIDGGSGDDVLLGGTGSDILRGGDGDDILAAEVLGTLWVDTSANTLEGGKGNDTLYGGVGADTYIFNGGDGVDTIYETYLYTNQYGLDRIVLGEGITEQDISVITPGFDLVLNIGTGGDQIIIKDWYAGFGHPVDELKFADGTIWDLATLHNKGLTKYGTDSDDVLMGVGANYSFALSQHHNTIYGFGGNDYIVGGPSDDLLDGGEGDDILVGGMGLDLLRGGAGNDTIYANVSANIYDSSGNTLEGGQGNDVLYGTVEAETYIFNVGDGADEIYEGNNPFYEGRIDRIVFGEGIYQSDVSVKGMGYDLTLMIGTQGDQITIKNWNSGSARIEELVFFDGSTLNMEALNNAWIVQNGDDSDEYFEGRGWWVNDTIYGAGGNDVIYGLGGDDLLYGGAGQDEVYGDEGDDTLIGGLGEDRLFGGNGADTYEFSRGDGADYLQDEGDDGAIDTIQFKGGIMPQDLITYNWTAQDLVLYLGNGDSITIGNWYNDAKYQIEKFIFSDGTVLSTSELPIPSTNPLVQYGTNGDDFLKALNVNVLNEVYGSGGNDTITSSWGVNYLDGGSGNDTFQLGSGTNTLVGGLGNDIYFDNIASDDTYVFNIGDGVDTLYENAKGSISDQLEFGSGIAFSDLSFERVEADLIIGVGALGDQVVVKNWFYGAKIETLKFANGAVFNLITGNPEGGDVFGSPTNDILLGFDGEDVLSGDDGIDILVGGNGNDTYIVDNTTDTIKETVNGGIDTVQTNVTYTLGASSNLENLTLTGTAAINGTGNALDNVLIGNSANNTLNGGNGNDTLEGGAGVDTLIGGIGDDTYIIDSTTDTLTEFSTGGIDTVLSSVTYTLGAFLENLTITGTSNLSGFGNSLNNIITGNSGSNTLNGWGGIDTLIGGAGNDVYIVDTASDIIIENANEGTDTVRSDVTYVLGNNVENLILTGTGGAINGTGNALSNAITGNAYANIIDGGAGNDYLTGGDGNDTYIIDTTGDTIVETATGGIDTVKSSVTYTLGASSNLENLTLTGTSAINGTGNSLSNFLLGNSGNNTLTDTSGGNDILQGLGGVDTFNDTSGNNLLDGGVGADVITTGSGSDFVIGGTSNDTINTGAGYDVIMFNKGDGIDTINASVGTDNTLSLGGNFAYSDLSLTKSSNDLILKMGASDQITLKGWYNTGANNKSVLNLQVIAEAMQGFSLGGSDTLRDNKVETFNFANLVAAFDAAGATANWQLTDARLTAHLSAGSDTAAIGGDIAYQYGNASSLTGVGLLAAQAVMNNASVGQSAQTLNASSSWATETIKLS